MVVELLIAPAGGTTKPLNVPLPPESVNDSPESTKSPSWFQSQNTVA